MVNWCYWFGKECQRTHAFPIGSGPSGKGQTSFDHNPDTNTYGFKPASELRDAPGK